MKEGVFGELISKKQVGGAILLNIFQVWPNRRPCLRIKSRKIGACLYATTVGPCKARSPLINLLLRMFRFLSKFFFRLAGWEVEGHLPVDVPKGLFVVAPHFYSQDFLLGLGARASLSMDIGFLGKKELFTWYGGWLFRGLGGHPVDRKRNNNLVEAVAAMFKERESLYIALAPEGTRLDVAQLKLGFYYIALQAQIPLIPVGLDFPRKKVVVGAPIHVKGNFAEDLRPFYDFYLTIEGPKKQWLKAYEKTRQLSEPAR